MVQATDRQLLAVAELAKRRCEALKLFRALPTQTPFFRNASRETLMRGGNRSGKSTVSAVRFASIATDQPIHDDQGQEIECRLPWQKGRCLTMWVIGYGQNHIGQTLYRLLFRSGLFKIIRDDKTKQWRAFDPVLDRDRSADAKPSPPLIPARYIKPNSFSWENKGERVFTKCVVWNPETREDLAEIYAFTSSGEVKAGDPVDEIWIDEAIKYPSHYAEWQARLVDRRGRLVWSSWPQTSNNALRKLTDRAKECASDPNPLVREFLLTMSGNPHLSEESKREALEGWSEEEAKARDRGEYNTDSLRMYPSFSDSVHAAIIDGDGEDELSRILRDNNYEPPRDWTRELILDPGTSFPGVLLCAIPPRTLGDYVVPYQEIYIPRLDADKLAVEIRKHTESYMFERFIIDPRAGRQTPMGFNTTIERNYQRAFEENLLRCVETGSGFSWGSDDVAGRIVKLQSWMTIRSNGKPKLRIVKQRCPNLCYQLTEYMKAVREGLPIEYKPDSGQKIDLAVCLEYWASREPVWIAPMESSAPSSSMHKLYLTLLGKRKKKEKKSPDSINLGPATV